jgi:hypothetical protein
MQRTGAGSTTGHRDVNTLKAIETRYDGCLFRSRREARWAVFFNEARIPWEYEPQGYDLGEAGWYLPDFRINADTHSELFFEVKGESPNREELAKAAALTEQSKLPVYVYFAEVRLPAPASLAGMDQNTYFDALEQEFQRDMLKEWLAGRSPCEVTLHKTWADDCEPTAFRPLRRRGGGIITRPPAAIWWTDCPQCGLVIPKLWGQAGLCPGLNDDDATPEPLYPRFRHATERLQHAYEAARSARFGR